MANILLTNYCNRNCSYCFAMDKVGSDGDWKNDKREAISLENFNRCVEFLKRSKIKVISLLGGEPTLHPHFKEILDICRRDNYFDNIKLFTNGLMSDDLIEYLADFEGPELHIALNIHTADEYKSKEWKRIETVLQRLRSKIGLGYNIYYPDFNLDFIMELILKYKLLPHMRLGLTQPIMGIKNIHITVNDFPVVAERITATAEKFTRHNLFFSFDCGFPFCMFTLEQHKRLLSCAINFRSVCDPIIDIGTDLSVWRCFPLSGLNNQRLEDFETRMDIKFLYQKMFSHYQRFGIYSQCLECNYRKQKLCTGGCLSRILQQFHTSFQIRAQA